MAVKSRLRRTLAMTFWCSALITMGGTYYYIEKMIPDHLNVVANEREEFYFGLPFQTTLESEGQEVVLGNGSNIPADQINLSVSQPFTIYSENLGSYNLGVKLFGWLQLKEIQVDVVDSQFAIPCGTPIGIYLKSNGVMVIGTGEIQEAGGSIAEPALGILQSGDYIEAINGQDLQTKDELMEALVQNGDKDAILTVRRDGTAMDFEMSPVKAQDGSYKLGVWVRDDTQGIGTMTYVDLNGNFGALGHGISDSDTGSLVETSNGSLYETEIVGINKGTAGTPGVMSGVIYYGNQSVMGNITANTNSGIFGTVNEKFARSLTAQPVEIGYLQDVEKGPAHIRSSISGEVKDYEIEITKVDSGNAKDNKGLVLKVVDEELLALTGGIVQGMSGSPIIQNGKLIGAVTHVFIQDSTRGYGILIENMLKH